MSTNETTNLEDDWFSDKEAKHPKGKMTEKEKEELFEQNPKFKEMNEEYGDVVKDKHNKAAALEGAWFPKTASRINPIWLDKFEVAILNLLAKNNLFDDEVRYLYNVGISGDKFEVNTQVNYSQNKNDDAHVVANHRDAKKIVEKAVSAAVKSLGSHKVTVTMGHQDKAEYGKGKSYEYGSCLVNILVDAPKWSLFKTLKEIAKELKSQGYRTQTYKDELEVEFQSDALGNWEYTCWDMNLTQYQNANNKLHQELAKKLKEQFPSHQIRPDKGYNEAGYAIAFIKMP
tara:strand:- start:1583 stop:2443 length:861 start_codon:yes stop_codon:yes gene_type:complete